MSRIRSIVQTLSLVAIGACISVPVMLAQSAPVYHVLPNRLSVTSGSASGTAVLHLTLPELHRGAPITFLYSARIPQALAGKVTISPAQLRIKISAGTYRGQSQRFRFLVSAKAPFGSFTIPLILNPPAAALLSISHQAVAKISLTITSRITTTLVHLTPIAQGLTVKPSRLALTAGASSAPIAVSLQFATARSSAQPKGIRVTISRAVAPFIKIEPTPLTYLVGAAPATSAHTSFRVHLFGQAPPGTYKIRLFDLGYEVGSATLTLTVSAPSPRAPAPPTAPAAPAAPPPKPHGLKVSPATVSLYPGRKSGSIAAILQFSTARSAGSPKTIRVTLPRALSGFVRVEPSPLTYTVGTAPTNAARTSFQLEAKGDAPPGIYKIELFDLGYEVGSATLTLTVEKAGSLGVRFDPDAVSLCAGATTTGKLVVEPAAGYEGRPELAWSQLSTGITVAPARLESPTLPPSASLPIKIAADADAKPGRHEITVTASDSRRHIEEGATLEASVTPPELTATVPGAPLVLRQGQALQPFALEVKPNACLGNRDVRIEISGAPRGLILLDSSGTVRAPNYRPFEFRLRALPTLPLGKLKLTATLNARGVPTDTLAIPIEIEKPGITELVDAPYVDRVEPQVLTRGKTYELVLEGRNLTAGTTISFGEGFEQLAPPFFSSRQSGQIKVRITSQAPLGVHEARAANQHGESNGPGAVEIQTQAPDLVPEIDALAPDQVQPGKTYLLVLKGKNLNENVAVDLGKGLEVTGPLRATTGGFAVKVAVAADAPGGTHVATASAKGGSSRGPGSLRVGGSRPPLVSGIAAKPWTPPQGQIILDDPEWGHHVSGEFTQELGVPAITDDLKLDWHEENPGTADYFVLHILDRTGKKVLISQRIDPGMIDNGVRYPYLPSFFHLTSSLIAKLSRTLGDAALPSGAAIEAKTGSIQLGKSRVAFGNASNASPPQTSALDAAGHRDFLWEVVGYRLIKAPAPSDPGAGTQQETFNPILTSAKRQPIGASVPEPQGTEVEISDRWPLRLPVGPTGLVCPAAGRGELNAADIDQAGQETAKHPGDRFQLTGSISLKSSPFVSQPQGVHGADVPYGHQFLDPAQSGEQNAQIPSYDTYQFDNVFIDWGDGTVVPLRAKIAQASLQWTPDQSLELLGGPSAPEHRYSYPGTYTIRIYQLSEDDRQNVDPSALSLAVDGLPGLDGGLFRLASIKGNGEGGSFNAQSPLPLLTTRGESPSDIASRAYMVYCKKVLIQSREDTCARGRLRLASINIIGFPGHNVKEKESGKILSARNLSKAATAMPNPALGGTARESSTQPTDVSKQTREAKAPKNEVEGTATSCDEAMTARARLTFVGQGEAVVRFRWEDGSVFYTSPILHLASKSRTDLGKDPAKWGPPFYSTVDVDAPLSVAQLGLHGISVEAVVMVDPLDLSLVGEGGQEDDSCPGFVVASREPCPFRDRSLCGNLGGGITRVSATSPGNASLQVGMLLPSGMSIASHSTAGGGKAPSAGYARLGSVTVGKGGPTTFAGLSGRLKPHPSGSKSPPDFVSSPQHHYQVVQANVAKPCLFLFPTADGTFRITDVNSHVTGDVNSGFSGQGVLKVPLTNGRQSISETAVKVQFSNWMAPDAKTVTKGTLDVAPNKQIQAPGMEVTVDRLQGTAGTGKNDEMLATLGIQPAAYSHLNPVPSWRLEEPLSSDGDWIASSQSLGHSGDLTGIGVSGFSLESKEVTLDLSRSAGSGPSESSCGASGKTFAGIDLGHATLHMLDFGGQPLLGDASGWVVGSEGVCGSTNLAGPIQRNWGEGWLEIGGIVAEASDGAFHATYKDFEVYSPWFGKPLGGKNLKIFDTGGTQHGFTLPGLGDAPLQTWGDVTMKATDLSLIESEGIGWAIHGQTRFHFASTEGKFLAQLDTDRLYFKMADSEVYFKEGKSSTTIPLQGVSQPGKPYLGDVPLDLESVDLLSPHNAGTERLKFDFLTQPRLSSSRALTAPEVRIGYAIDKTAAKGSTYAAKGPATAPFKATFSFPRGTPQVAGSITPHYQPGSSFFCGGLDLGMLGGKGLAGGTATFVLGYDSSTGRDGWLAYYNVPVGGATGIPIAPPLPIDLFSINGGLGYNIAAAGANPKKGSNPFAHPLTCGKHFTITDGGTIFAAGLEAATPDHTTVTVRGELSISKSWGTAFYVDSWLMSSDHNRPGDIQGVLRWDNGAFDGKLWGHYSFLDNTVQLSLGTSESDAAVDMMFAKSGDWHVYAGKKHGTPIEGRVLFAKADAWLDLSGQGLSNIKVEVGGRQSVNLSASLEPICGDTGAHAEFDPDLTLGLNPPKIAGSAHASFSLSVCGYGVFSLDGDMALGCCGPYAHAHLCIDPCPIISCNICGGFSL